MTLDKLSPLENKLTLYALTFPPICLGKEKHVCSQFPLIHLEGSPPLINFHPLGV